LMCPYGKERYVEGKRQANHILVVAEFLW